MTNNELLMAALTDAERALTRAAIALFDHDPKEGQRATNAAAAALAVIAAISNRDEHQP